MTPAKTSDAFLYRQILKEHYGFDSTKYDRHDLIRLRQYLFLVGLPLDETTKKVLELAWELKNLETWTRDDFLNFLNLLSAEISALGYFDQ